MPRPRPASEYHRVRALLAKGVTYREIEKRTGVPYWTIHTWRKRSSPPGPNGRARSFPPPPADWRPPGGREYCYLLGLYLGDGCLSQGPRGAPWLVVSLDAKYPGIIARAGQAIKRTFPGIRVRVYQRPGLSELKATHPGWTSAFPQHGPGRKHTRKIELVPWQLALTRRHPRALLRGLYHSDGCRCINRFKVALPSGRVGQYEYVRYFFTNYSDDIRQIFCDHCDLLRIRWTQSSFKNISVSHRDSVAILDSFLGPKR